MEITENYLDDFVVYGNPAHGGDQVIPIAIGKIAEFGRLTDDNLGSIFEIINQKTLTPYYPFGESRAQHNGTHSARQARMMEVLIALFDEATRMRLSSEEIMHLKLAAYLLRSGRIDESSHEEMNPDDYYTRSAMIYEAYARQLEVSEDTVNWISHVICNSCKPIGSRDADIDENQKWKLGWDCLAIVHEADLLRCFSKKTIDTRIKLNTASHLAEYFQSPTDLTEKLFNYSKALGEATGCWRVYDGYGGNSALFQRCSISGKTCWNRMQQIGFYDFF